MGRHGIEPRLFRSTKRKQLKLESSVGCVPNYTIAPDWMIETAGKLLYIQSILRKYVFQCQFLLPSYRFVDLHDNIRISLEIQFSTYCWDSPKSISIGY